MIIKIGENTYTQSDIQELRTSICKLENEISECDNTIESKISKEEPSETLGKIVLAIFLQHSKIAFLSTSIFISRNWSFN